MKEKKLMKLLKTNNKKNMLLACPAFFFLCILCSLKAFSHWSYVYWKCKRMWFIAVKIGIKAQTRTPDTTSESWVIYSYLLIISVTYKTTAHDFPFDRIVDLWWNLYSILDWPSHAGAFTHIIKTQVWVIIQYRYFILYAIN